MQIVIFLFLFGVVVGICFAHYHFKKSVVREIENKIKGWNVHLPYKNETAVAPVKRVLKELLEKIEKI